MHVFASAMRKTGVQVDLHYLGELNNPRALFRVQRQMPELSVGYDLVHAQFGSACALATANAKIPKVLSLRGSDWYYFREKINYQAFHSTVANAMTRCSVGDYNSIVVMSNRMRLDVSSKFPGKMIEVIPDPIDLSQFVPIPKEVARSLLGFPNDSSRWVLFTTLSTENPIKRVSLAKRAVEIANERLGDIRLKVATGLRHDQMPLFVASCDVVLSTSVYEGWPNCVKEALACNIPFVATDVSDLSDISAVESSCRICPPDARALAEGIEDALRSPPVELRRYINEMSLDLSCRKLLMLYDRAMSNH